MRRPSLSWHCWWFAWFLHIFEDDSMRILLLETGDQGIAVDVPAKPQVPGLDNSGSEHHEDVGDLGKQRFGPGLEWIGK